MLQTFKANIENNINFQFVKFGDGEFICIDGQNGYNCDFHPYSKELGEKILNAFVYLSQLKSCYIGEWIWGYEGVRQMLLEKTKAKPKFIDYNIILQQVDKLTPELYDFYSAIKFSKRKKIFVGNYRLKDVCKLINFDKHIIVPEINCFSHYEQILYQCKAEISKDCIFIFSAGMPAKPLIHELIISNSRVTCIDAGSAFDPIFFNITRHNQPPKETLQEFYKGLLTS